MTTTIYLGRYTATADQPLVVFLVGMRINRLRAILKWWPTFTAMIAMLKELLRHPEKGYLGGRVFFSGRTIMLVQYWRSFEELDRFARNPADPHLPAWQRFNKHVGYVQGTVGVFHETYVVPAGQMEAIYNNMPRFGLAGVAQHVPATGKRATARRRLGGAERGSCSGRCEWRTISIVVTCG